MHRRTLAADSNVAKSRARTPTVSNDGASGHVPQVEIRPRLGLKPNRPQHTAGILILPPVSVPRPMSANLAATAAAAPPEEPPTTYPSQTGFLTVGVRTPKPAASVAVRPTTCAPAFLLGAHAPGVLHSFAIDEQRQACRKGLTCYLNVVLNRDAQSAERTLEISPPNNARQEGAERIGQRRTIDITKMSGGTFRQHFTIDRGHDPSTPFPGRHRFRSSSR